MEPIDYWQFEEQTKEIEQTDFIGFNNQICESKILKLIKLENNEQLVIVDKTTIYPQGGGQTSDEGILKKDNEFKILEAKKINGVILHRIQGVTNFKEGDIVKISHDKDIRLKLEQNHSTTHILWSLIEKELGFSLKQAFEWITPNEVKIEMIDENSTNTLNQEIIDKAVINFHKLLDQSIESKIYFENDDLTKRVVEFPTIIKEYCGGTHIKNTNMLKEIEIKKLAKKSNKYKLTFSQK